MSIYLFLLLFLTTTLEANNYCNSMKTPDDDNFNIVLVNHGPSPLIHLSCDDHYHGIISYPEGLSDVLIPNHEQQLQVWNHEKIFYGGCLYKFKDEQVHFTWYKDNQYGGSNYCIVYDNPYLLGDIYLVRNMSVYYEIYTDWNQI